MKEILEVLERQRQFFLTGKTREFAFRKQALKKLRANILDMKEEIFEALKKDLNKSEEESYMTEVGLTLSEISYMLKKGRKFSRKKRVVLSMAQFPAKGYKMPVPYGNVLIISPWNYPFMLAIEPIVDAITAGNCVILKPSEISPNVSEVVKKLIEKTFERGFVDVVMGGKEECSFLLDQDFDYIFFTGSTRVGKIVMEKASQHFTPVTLELGGKCPCIVDKSADLKLTARRIVFGKFLNSGQTCVAPDFVYCDRTIKDKLIEELIQEIKRQYNNALTSEDYPKMINAKQFNVMKAFIEKDKVIYGGECDEKTLKIEPTLISSTFESEAMQDEIFGPILPIVTFDNLSECEENLRRFSKPLALYIFSRDKRVQKQIAINCDFGGGCINDTIMHIADPKLGFGGIKQSGIGSYHGKSGFDTFTHYKSIVKKAKIDLPMRYHPISKIKYKIIKMFLK